jgi:C1A family cysteine protease
MSATCPSGGGGGNSRSGSGSQDQNENYDYGDDGKYGFTQNTYSRYGSIKGYGYATERCVCYTDGTGCDCDDQDEGLAVGNLATYGPAVVCVDASDWQDYAGGIITSSSGCSAKFLDVNHCVQVVGYAFASDTDDSNDEQNSRSGSGSQSGSQDDEDRQGYWIVRNQWSAYWGMNGYAYVAMGENTCGILNNMIQVYTKNK